MKWTKDKCKEEALKYKSRTEFQKNCNNAYRKSIKFNWLNDICSHMIELIKPKEYWTKERCHEESLKYKSRSEFQKKSGSAYTISLKNKWLNEICSHMVETKKPKEYWTFEKCREETLKYKTRIEFQKKSNGAYAKSLKNKWLKEICSHMVEIKKPNGYWTKEKCHDESLKYEYRSEFKIKSTSAYNKSKNEKWLDEICSHMTKIGNIKKRCIYAYEFSDKCVYVGLTFNLKKRYNNRKTNKKDAVTKHIIKTNLQPIIKQLTEYIDIEEARIKEGEYVKKYKDENWIILNIAKTGGIGGNTIKWSKEKCQEEAQKYNTRKDFLENSYPAYRVSCENGWLNDFCSNMIDIRKTNKYWTEERCKEEALKYETRSEFNKKSRGAFESARRRKILDVICSLMIEIRKPNGYWTKERCKDEALKYNTKTEFSRKNEYVYQMSLKNKWMNDICDII